MDDGEIVHTPLDKTRDVRRMDTLRRSSVSQGKDPAPPALWTANEVLNTPDRPLNHPGAHKLKRDGRDPERSRLWSTNPVYDGHEFRPEPCHGRYPKGFLAWALNDLRLQGREVLHVCSGALTPDEALGGLRVDLRTSQVPDVVADGRKLPFRDGAFAAVFLDPPYSVEYAKGLYNTEYPRPSHLLAEASRVTRAGGAVCLLHYLVPVPPAGARLERVVGVTQGLGYRIRAWTIYRREETGDLFE